MDSKYRLNIETYNIKRNYLLHIKKIITATPCIINGYFSPTYVNPCGFFIRFLFAKLMLKHATNYTQLRYIH